MKTNLFVTNSIKVPLGQSADEVKARVAKFVGINLSQLMSVQLKKQSIDARDKSNVHFVCSFVVECSKSVLKNAEPYKPVEDLLLRESQPLGKKHCVVVGGGPSGLFLARFLSQNGIKVTVIERGSDVSRRQQVVKSYFDGGAFDESCNVQFGLGGAGTFSDGKLTTGISSPIVTTVFNEFVRNGAPSEILTSSLPHIGTDNLVNTVANLRDKIIACGGEFLFDSTVQELIVQNNSVLGVQLADGRKISADCVALCCGHSARNLFENLHRQGVLMQQKPFAVGLRIEHTREFINKTQYGELFATHRDLGAASYKLTNNIDNHGCYSFCMCPGGVVVPSNSEYDTVVVNGMSDFLRDAANSNSALVVTVGQQDLLEYGYDGVFAGMNFQQHLEQSAYKMGGGNYKAPVQNVTDFLNGKVSQNLDIVPSYPRGVTSCNLQNLLPQKICDILASSLLTFDKKMKGFARCGVLSGVETRTSSPVKILRDESYQANILGLYPVGEGAGHAGGIVSAAVDGLKVAQSIINNLS